MPDPSQPKPDARPAAGSVTAQPPHRTLGRPMPTLLRAPMAPDGWQQALGRAATLGFTDLLLPAGPLDPRLIGAARGLRVGLVQDLEIGRVAAGAPWLAVGDPSPPGAEPAAPWRRLPAPMLDPRAEVRADPGLVAAIETTGEAAALGRWWGLRLAASDGLMGVRLLGLETLPEGTLGAFAAALREAAPELLLFAWTPGLHWSALASVPRGVFDLVASSLPWWDGQADWLWRELELLARLAPVVADAGGVARFEPLAAILAEGWMTDGQGSTTEGLVQARKALAGLPYTRSAGPGGHALAAVLRTDQPDPRAAGRGGLAVAALHPGASLAAQPLLRAAAAGPFTRFVPPQGGPALLPADLLAPPPGEVLVFLAEAAVHPPPAPLDQATAREAAAGPRVAIEEPSPCVEAGRYPARFVLGSEVRVEADIIGDGHDVLSAALRWRTPGSDTWHEVPMRPFDNDRWQAHFPLSALGVHEYVIEAWKDAYGSFVHELEAKHRAGVPIGLELEEGRLLIEAAAARSRKALRIELAAILDRLAMEGADGRRAVLLAPATQAAMARADDRPRRATTAPIPVRAERQAAAFASWYEVFPRSMSDDPERHGTFRDVVRHLPRIAAMGFDVLYFPPIHPIGRVNRKGRNNSLTPAPTDPGSPYAIGAAEGGHDAIHPDLGSIEDFQHLRAEAARWGIEIALDFAIQCSPDHPWLREHKDWFDWRPDGTIRYAENPPKKYEDIVNVDFYAPGAIPGLWLALAGVVLYWAGQGVRLFRVDNPHTKPLPFWEWMIAEVQARHPDAVFLAEAFTRPKLMYRLAKVGFSQSYSYFAWRESRGDFEQYLTELTQGPPRDFFRPNFFVNTPDINPVPLQTAPRQGFLVRAALATLLSGLWGLYNGFELCEATPVPGREEYLDSEKYQIRAWDWNRPGNIIAEIAQLNAIRRLNPALQTHLGVTFLDADDPQVLAFEKATPDRANVILCVICTDLRTPRSASLDLPFWRWPERPGALLASDLVGGARERWTPGRRHFALTADQPYAVWRLAPAGDAA